MKRRYLGAERENEMSKNRPDIAKLTKSYRISTNGKSAQISLPSYVLEALGWKPGDRIEFSANATRQTLEISRVSN